MRRILSMGEDGERFGAHTCTTAAGKAISSGKATYTGAASGSPDLTGTAKLEARSTIDTTDGVGVVTGTLQVGKTKAQFSAVYDHGSIAGTATGHTAGHVQPLANVSAGFGQTAGFTGGKIGGGTAGGSAVELTPGGCGSSESPHEGTEARGAITALSASSITVAGLTCNVPASLATKVLANFALGMRVDIRCTVAAGVNTLVRIDKKR